MSATIARLIGGAGTGKTTELLQIMQQVIEAGIHPAEIGFASFTRAARHVAAQRAGEKFGIAPAELEHQGWFRTVHSTCYKSLGMKAAHLLTGNKESVEWLKAAIDKPVSGVVGGDFEETGFVEEASPADKALACWDVARARLESLETAWRRMRRTDGSFPPLSFCELVVTRYEQKKFVDDRFDFTDLVAHFAGRKFRLEGPEVIDPQGECPSLPVWFFDEQQDASALLDLACKRLISQPDCMWVYVVGDPFQSIFGWCGAESKYFRAWPAAKERIMPKSWRCGQRLLELGERCLRRCKDYFDRGIAPAEHESTISEEGSVSSLVDRIKGDDEWLLIARSNFEARRWAAALEDKGVPWKPTRGMGGFNAPKKNMGMLALHTLQQGGPVSGHEWIEVLKLLPQKAENGKELLTRGVKTHFDKEQAERFPWVLPHELDQLGAAPALNELIASGAWKSLVPGSAKYCAAVERWGSELCARPKVRVGTVHSVKGEEADNVALLTTLSGRAYRASQADAEHRDEEARVNYVAVTRARKHLALVRGEGPYRMEVRG